MAGQVRNIVTTKRNTVQARNIVPAQQQNVGQQRNVVASTTSSTGPHHSIHGIGGFFHNLASGAESAARGFGPGLGTLGASLVHDYTHLNSLKAIGEMAVNPVIGYKDFTKHTDTGRNIVGPMVHGYNEKYAVPLEHGDFRKLGHNVYADPFGTLLDASALFTGGAGAVGRAGGLLEKAGAISDTSRLARLGKPVDLTVPDLAKQAGQAGKDVLLKRSARNPLIKARQVGVNKLLNAANPRIPIVGSEARLARVTARTALKEGQALALKSTAFRQSFARLSKTAKAVWHLRARQLDPEGYATLLERGAIDHPGGTEEAMIKRLDEPKLRELYAKGSKKLDDALVKGQALSDLMTAEKVDRGYIGETTAAESPYLAQRVLHGAEIVGKDDVVKGEPSLRTKIQTAKVERIQTLFDRATEKAKTAAEDLAAKTNGAAIGNRVVGEGLPQKSAAAVAKNGKITGPGRATLAPHAARAERLGGALSVAKDHLAQMEASDARRIARKGGVKEQGVHDLPGNSIEELAQSLANEGKQQPFYVPDSAETGKLPLRSWRPTSTNPPMRLASTRQNLGTLIKRGMINLHGDSLTAEHARFARHVQRTDIHEALMELAAKEPESGLPKGYTFLKTTSGQKGASYTERAAADLKEALTSSEDKGSLRDRFTTKHRDDPNIAVDGEGHRLIIPDHVAELLSHEAQSTRGLVIKTLFDKPTSLWKHMVLGLRPAYMANILLSQHVLGALQIAPDGHGLYAYLNHLIPGARLGKLTDHTIEDVMPEQAHATFSSSAGATSNKGLGIASAAYQGVMPATLKVENWLRRLMIEGWANSEPEIRAAMKTNGGDINAAMREVAKTHPHVLDEISQKVDHAQGNYRSYSPAEQRLRYFVPFYGWDRHIVQSTYRIFGEHPARALGAYQLGQQGHAINERDFGALPTYLQDLVKIHLPTWMGPVAGYQAGVSTKAISPFQADADLGGTAWSLLHGRAGTHTEEAGNINPLITGAWEQLTGRSSLTGAPLKDSLNQGIFNIFIRAGLNVPQARLVTEAVGLHPLGKPKHPPASLVDIRLQAASILGVPVKQLDLAHEHLIAGLQGSAPK